MCGVCTCGWPPSGSTQSLRSSIAMKRILGLRTLLSDSEHAAKATGISAARRSKFRVSRRRCCTDAKIARSMTVAAADLRTRRASVAVCAGRSIVPVAAKHPASCRGPFQPGKLLRITEILWINVRSNRPQKPQEYSFLCYSPETLGSSIAPAAHSGPDLHRVHEGVCDLQPINSESMLEVFRVQHRATSRQGGAYDESVPKRQRMKACEVGWRQNVIDLRDHDVHCGEQL